MASTVYARDRGCGSLGWRVKPSCGWKTINEDLSSLRGACEAAIRELDRRHGKSE